MSSTDQFIAVQRQRLEALKRATERERSLLTAEAPPLFSASSEPRNGVHHHLQHPPHNGLQSFASTHSASSNTALRIREDDLRMRAAKLAEEHEALQLEEARVDRRMAAAEEAKRDLLATLIALQYREVELKERAASLDEEEASVRTQVDEAKQRLREVNHQKELLEHDVVERQAKLSLSKKKIADRQAEQSKVIQRLKQQLNEQEDRVRSIELQYLSKVRAADDLEREVHRQMQLQRDAELAAIEDLRADIQRTRAEHGWN